VKRIFLLAIAAILLSGPAISSLPVGASDRVNDVDQIMTLARVGRGHSLSAQCCKVCHQGKACGNTCISRQYVCHVGQGCACDG
jgi:hypothetical protein